MSKTFPEDFSWGVATSSYQIEGAATEGGRGESIWDRFSHTPGKVLNGDTGDIACNHYHLYRDDVKLMGELGVLAYRFSIAWSRVIPDGKGEVNQAGLDFYDRLVNSLLSEGIEPFATLYHWDLPQALYEEGGWLNRTTADYFAYYADVISRRLGDRVHHWMTFNEPLCVAILGHVSGEHAPGHKDSTFGEATQVNHHVYLAHGKAIPVLRANSGPTCQIGIVLNMSPIHPATNSAADVAAAYRADGLSNRWFADPIFKGEYPTDMLALFGECGPKIEPGDMEIISTPIDMLGLNYYTRNVIADAPDDPGIIKTRNVHIEPAEYTTMGWEVYPDGLYELLVRVQRDYHPAAIYITENGCASADELDKAGKVHDEQRVNYLRSHFEAAHRALKDGVSLKGYFVWSFMDNFEWNWGYDRRFGIVYIDFATQQRTPKDSFHFYQRVIRDNALPGA
ncbi:MAG: GH1 family beta-glucosidase [Chloroflexota bacterium]